MQIQVTYVGDTKFELPSRYNDLRRLGLGSQGLVVCARDLEENRPVAIKKLSKPFHNLLFAKRAFREIKLMQLVNHVNIIKLLDLFSPQKSLDKFQDVYIVMELMDDDFVKVIKKMNFDRKTKPIHQWEIDHEKMSYLLYQLLCGVKHLHSAGIIHRDLKPSNIVVDRQCTLKILDFGLARCQDFDHTMTQYVVTRFYRAPEAAFGINYSPKLDIWSVGCILGEMILGEIVFNGETHIDQIRKIIEILGSPTDDFKERLDPRLRYWLETRIGHHEGKTFEQLFPDSNFPPNSTQYEQISTKNARDLLSKMLVIDDRKRISVDEALQHPYVSLWFREDEVHAPPPADYDSTIESEDLTLDQWKKFIFDEVKQYEARKQSATTTLPPLMTPSTSTGM